MIFSHIFAFSSRLVDQRFETDLCFQGYASLAQTDTGLHMRQRSRVWIVADANNATNRIVFINAGKLSIPRFSVGHFGHGGASATHTPR